MSLLTRKQFIGSFVCIFGAALVPSVLLCRNESGSVLLVRKITDRTALNFDHSAFYINRKDFLDEQKFYNLTQQMIANKEILELRFEHNPTSVHIEIKFKSKKEYSKYLEITRSFVNVDSFNALNYTISDKIIRV